MAKRALVTGGSGQDGWYMIELLLQLGYEVHAQSRRMQAPGAYRGIVTWHVGELTDAAFLKSLIAGLQPDEIYNLASVSSPVQSVDIPRETELINATVPLRICELVRDASASSRLFQACSSEIFGDCPTSPQDETTPPQPQTPYGHAKLSAHRMIGKFRREFGLHASSGIMFNHESPRRPLRFVSQKIAHAAAAISLGLRETDEKDERGGPVLHAGKVKLGNLDVRRDFGFAGDYVKAMHLILQSPSADDYVIATNSSHSVGEFCEQAFRHVGREWRDHVESDPALVRKVDSRRTVGDYTKIARLGWRPETSFSQLVGDMVDARIALLQNARR